ncbi:hypothetical protein BDA99DRAFT_231271 [Phascolomyces articulosus]|uniref:Uncharacterized protein n=1 Tax=Phascolomyces articulosus TaxID=60185 RepID=A0AAD5JP55_9FUNG|nr:hypothetical protein BDA99DRAFT_231271 [Phascolomyces articulosus]
MYTNSFKITELDDDKALPLKTDDIHGMSVYYLPNKACSISSPNCMMERDSEQVPSVNDLTHSLSQISQQNWDPNFAYQSAPEIDPSQRFCFNKTTAEIDNLYRLPSPPHEPYSNSHRNYQLNYFISQIQNPSIDSVQDYYCDNNNINVSGFPSALYNHQAVSTMETIKPISTVFGSTDSDVSQYSGYSAFSKQNMTNITTSDGQYSMLSESLQHRMPQDDIIKRSDWQNHVGHGLTELLYPFNDCTVIDTDTQFNIISCWTSNKEHMAQQKVFDYRFEYLKKKNINILFTERCKERIFRDRESNSYDETIVFCGDIIYIITGSRRNNRKWMSLWVKEKKNNANQIIGYVFILVDNCKLICHIKIDNKGTILGAHKPSGPGTSHHQTKKDGIPYDMEYFLKYPQNMIKGMSYHKALGELDKPLITFHGLHYFIAKPDPELETNVLDVVAIKYITGMASISWKAEEFIWASETLSGCLFGETENPRHIEGQPVMKRLPQLPSVIDQFHQQNSNPNMNDGNEQERPCITGMNYAKCENDNGSMLFSNLDQLMDSETSNHDHVIYTNDDLNCSMCINNNSDDMDYEKINYIKNGILHGSIMKYDDCILNAFVAGVWRTGKVHRFTAKSKNGSEYKFEHMSIQLSYNKSIPHWVFLKYRFIPQWSTDSNEYHKIQKIGKGSYGTTHQALDLATLDQVTIILLLLLNINKQ